MRRRRLIVVAAALTLGAAAGGGAYVYLNGVQNRAYHDARLVEVYVADGTIPQGTTGLAAIDAGLIKKEQVPRRFEPAHAIGDLAAIRNDVAATAIPPQQVVVDGLFVQQGFTGGTAARMIPKGDVAITISVDQVHGVAGLVQPGDDVDLLVQLANGRQEAYLFQNVPVLAIGSTLAAPGSPSSSTGTSSGTPASPSGLVTFAVPPTAAARIALAASGAGGVTGSIYLALVPPGNQPTVLPAISSGNLLPVGPTPS